MYACKVNEIKEVLNTQMHGPVADTDLSMLLPIGMRAITALSIPYCQAAWMSVAGFVRS